MGVSAEIHFAYRKESICRTLTDGGANLNRCSAIWSSERGKNLKCGVIPGQGLRTLEIIYLAQAFETVP